MISLLIGIPTPKIEKSLSLKLGVGLYMQFLMHFKKEKKRGGCIILEIALYMNKYGTFSGVKPFPCWIDLHAELQESCCLCVLFLYWR